MRNAKILVIEDNRGDIELLRDALEGRGAPIELFAVWTAGDAYAFLAKGGQFRNAPTPDLVLIDLNLPGADGRDILRSIKATKALKRVPVVVYSGASRPEEIDECLALGAAEYVVKPHGEFSYADLADQIARLAGVTAGRAG
jgi:two-component system, chemotaxis family, response regulator Rcp1